MLSTADDDIRLDPDFAKLGNRLLGRLSFDFASCCDEGKKCDVDEADVIFPHFKRELSESFKEKVSFNISSGTTNFGDDDISIIRESDLTDAVFNDVCTMWDELHRFT